MREIIAMAFEIAPEVSVVLKSTELSSKRMLLLEYEAPSSAIVNVVMLFEVVFEVAFKLIIMRSNSLI
jgi:hypothetical protein